MTNTRIIKVVLAVAFSCVLVVLLINWFPKYHYYYFAGDNPASGFEIWKCKYWTGLHIAGITEATAEMVKDINVGAGGSNPDNFTTVGNEVFFSARIGANGRELWKSDGTEEGTIMVKDINVGAGGSNPRDFISVGNEVFFSADNGANGYELWRSDGTEEGTVMVKDINVGAGGSNPDMVREINVGAGGSNPRDFISVGNEVLFSADNGAHGWELWRSDGTPEGTIMVKDINVGTGGSNPGYRTFFGGMTIAGNEVFFGADSGGRGRELWKSDGTPEGTIMVKDINVGKGDSNPLCLTTLGKEVFFSADNGANGRELWKSDGTKGAEGLNPHDFTEEVMKMVKEVMKMVKDIFVGAEGLNLRDFTEEVMKMVKDIFVGAEGSNPDNFTEEGTKMVKDIFVGAEGSYPGQQCVFGGMPTVGKEVFFAADNGANGNELWKSDGTEEGTIMFKDINVGAEGSNPRHFTSVRNIMLFCADDGQSGLRKSLWISNGTPEGTRAVRDKDPSGLGVVFCRN
jgi:ELWxxDGT repeat protein